MTSESACGSSQSFRKQAPKESVDVPEQSHPDWFWLTSGGVDSVAAFLLSRDALHENYGKRPVLVYLDTRVGVPFQRFYVEELADTYSEQLWTLRTHEKFEDRVAQRGKYADRDDTGAPGPARHSDVQNELKGRQRDKLASYGTGKPILVTGIRAEESEDRAATPKGEHQSDVRFVKPAFTLSKEECARIILRHPECPINPGWVWRHFTDCGCLSNGDPSELDAVAKRFPAFAQRLREYQEASEAAGLKSLLGWGGLSAEEQRAREQGQRQTTLCGGGCSRERPEPIARAFSARICGATPQQAIDVLDGRVDATDVSDVADAPEVSGLAV